MEDFCNTSLIQWPTHEQWMNMTYNWEHFPDAMAQLMGRSTRDSMTTVATVDITFSIQIVMDNCGRIVFIQSAFLGHNNDSAQLQMIGSSYLLYDEAHVRNKSPVFFKFSPI